MLTSSYLPPFRALLPSTLVLFAGQLSHKLQQIPRLPSLHRWQRCNTRPLSGLIRAMRINRCNPGAKPMIVWARLAAGAPMLRKSSRASPRPPRMLLLLAIPTRAITGRKTMMPLRATHAKLALSALGLAVLTGCASVSLDQNINRVNDEAGSFTGASSRWLVPWMNATSARKPLRPCSLSPWDRKRPFSWPW